MSKFPEFNSAQIESLSRCIGEAVIGSQITRIFEEKNITDNSGESTKWKRLYSVFKESQQNYQCSHKIIELIQVFLNPALFTNQNEEFEKHRQKLNKILIFLGLEYGKDGQFRNCEKAHTLDEAARRVQTIRSKLQERVVHPEILKYCRTELMQDNLFHAVFEASKGLAERIREKSNIDKDGTALVDKVFSIESPILAFNSLRSETEKSEHKGFASLLKGCFSAFRNPPAHQPKILWKGDENDIIDCFSLISFLHRRIDKCVPTQVRKE